MNRTIVAVLAAFLLIPGCSADAGSGSPVGGPNGGKGDIPNQDSGDDLIDPGVDPTDDRVHDPGDDLGDDPIDDPLPVEGSEAEPNNDAASANPASVPTALQGSLGAGDVDYFALQLEAGEAIEAETLVAVPEVAEDEYAAGTDTVIDVYAPGAAEPIVTDDDGGQNRGSLARFNAEHAGTYIIVVRGFSETVEGAYTLELRAGAPVVAPSGAETEPNDTSAQATALLALPAALTGEIEAAGVDYFSFQVGGGATVIVETGYAQNGATGTDTVIEVFGSDGSTSLGQDDDGSDEGTFSRLEVALPGAGTYFVKVTGYSESTTGPYAIRVSPRGGAAAE